MREKHIEYAIKEVEDKDVKFIRLWFTDALGLLKSVAIAPAELESAFREGIGFDGSAIEGWTREIENDMIALPDPLSFQQLPWRGELEGTARMFCDILTPEGNPSLLDSRYILKKQLEIAKDKGLSFYTHPELEFYLFEQTDEHSAKAGSLKPIDQGGYFEHVPRSVGHDFRRDVILTLEKMGISVEFSHHEAGPGQQEIDLRFADALTTADDIITFRTVVREKAIEHGMYASFMPKPMQNAPGSAMHTHVSLFEGETNIFYDPNSPEHNLSRIGQHFIAGILEHAPEISAITNQFVNSYTRLISGNEAPRYICWGSQNRSAMIRVPKHKPKKAESTRVEIRSIDSAANPYLSYSVILAAGLDGIERKLELMPEANDDVWGLTNLERKALGIKPLPLSLGDAIEQVRNSDFIAKTIGEGMLNNFLREKEAEWQKYQESVSQFEIDQLFSKL